MRLGLMTGYWSSGPPDGIDEVISFVDERGWDSIWTAEAYGSDALTPLAWWGASTRHVDLGTAIIQMAARTPTATAMAALTMDHLSGGRFRLGLGASGPQVVEGWYGQPYPRPLERTREYIHIVRQVFAREAPVVFSGRHFQLPVDNGAGLGKPLKSTVHPFRTEIPLYLAAEGPKNVALAAELCEGWLPFWFSPKSDEFYRECLQQGFSAAGKDGVGFDVACPIPIVIDDDVDAAADRVRSQMALYIGGMGAKDANFHLDVFVRMGWEPVCRQIQDFYLSGDKQQAADIIPLEMVEDVALVGPVEKIRDDLERWRSTVITTLLVSGSLPQIQTIDQLIDPT